jgi:hypothetical protein
MKFYFYLCTVIFAKIVKFSDMEERKKEIKVTVEIRKQLLAEFPVGDKTVYNALHYASDSYAARMIRCRALELGGCLMQQTSAEGEPKDGRSIAGGEPEEGGAK